MLVNSFGPIHGMCNSKNSDVYATVKAQIRLHICAVGFETLLLHIH